MAEDHYLDRTRFRSDRCGRATLLLTFQLDLVGGSW